MNHLIRFAADPPPSGGDTSASAPHVTHKPGIPQGDLDFMTVSAAVNTAWAANPLIKLIWMLQTDYATLVTNYSNTLTGRITTGATRPVQTQTLENLDTQIDHAVGEVKVYIANKYGRNNATAYYPQFGIEHTGAHWAMTPDHNERKQKLQMMIDAIAANGFGTNTYGTTFWTNTKTAFDAAVGSASTIDGTVSAAVGTKNLLKAQINKVQVALRHVLRGNYPDTYQEIYRSWGWQMEDY